MSVYLRHDYRDVRIFSDEKVFTLSMPYINTVWYHWQYIYADEKFILSVTFITI